MSAAAFAYRPASLEVEEDEGIEPEDF